MNKKRLIGYLLVIVSVVVFMHRRKSYLYPNTSYGMTVPRRYGPRHYPWKWSFGGHGIWNTRHRTNTTKRRNHLGGRPNKNANPNALEYIPKVRELVFAGKYLEAQTLATEKVMAKTNSGMPYQSFGEFTNRFSRTYTLF